MEEQKLNTMTVAGIVSAAVSQPTVAEEQRLSRLSDLQALRVMSTTEVRPEEPVLRVDGVGFFAKDDVHAVKGKQKCGKTTALKVCVAALLSGRQLRVESAISDARVLYLDTEQKQTDVKLIVTDVMRLSGLPAERVDERLAVYALRRRDFQLLLDDMKLLVSDFRPDVVIVDGIVEFVASFNDESMAKQLVRELLALSEDNHCATVCVLHTNKADEDHNMRGHLGTMLAQKSGTVIECRKQGTLINVRCADARHQEMPEWNIMFTADGTIADADDVMRQQREQHRAAQQQRRQEATEQKQRERTELALRIINNHGGTISRKELNSLLEQQLGLQRTTVSAFLTQCVKDHVIYEVNGMIQTSPNMSLSF